MIVPTSLMAYAALLADGVIGELQHQLLQYIYQFEDNPNMLGGVSRADAESHFADENQSFGPRFTELSRKGLLYSVGYKDSPKGNGRRVQIWRTTSNIDTDKFNSSKISSTAALNNLCHIVREVCAELKVSSKRRKRLLAAVVLAEKRQAPKPD